MNSPGLCMHVEIDFSGFLLQNTFIRVKIGFIGHIIVRSKICRSFDIFSFFNNTGSELKHRRIFFFQNITKYIGPSAIAHSVAHRI